MAGDKRVGVVLAGCGFLDGAEIQEATLTLLYLDRRGARVTAMAPDVEQMHVVDHARGEPASGERRAVLAESARIVRGTIVDLATVKARDLDALILPGGYGAAKNLCTFAVDGTRMKVNPEVERLVREVKLAGKPLGFICIAPVIAAKILGELKPKLTIGDDRETARASSPSRRRERRRGWRRASSASPISPLPRSPSSSWLHPPTWAPCDAERAIMRHLPRGSDPGKA